MADSPKLREQRRQRAREASEYRWQLHQERMAADRQRQKDHYDLMDAMDLKPDERRYTSEPEPLSDDECNAICVENYLHKLRHPEEVKKAERQEEFKRALSWGLPGLLVWGLKKLVKED